MLRKEYGGLMSAGECFVLGGGSNEGSTVGKFGGSVDGFKDGGDVDSEDRSSVDGGKDCWFVGSFDESEDGKDESEDDTVNDVADGGKRNGNFSRSEMSLIWWLCVK